MFSIARELGAALHRPSSSLLRFSSVRSEKSSRISAVEITQANRVAVLAQLHPHDNSLSKLVNFWLNYYVLQAVNYLEQKTVSTEKRQQLHITGYTASRMNCNGSALPL